MKLDKLALFALTSPMMIALVACQPIPQAKNEPTTVMEPTPGEALQADAAEYRNNSA